MYVCVKTHTSINICCWLSLCLTLWKWQLTGRGQWLWIVAEPASRSVTCWTGMDFCVNDCSPPVSFRLCVCVSLRTRACHTLPSSGYPLQPVQEANKLHFNMKNINFPLDGKLIMLHGLRSWPCQGCDCWEERWQWLINAWSSGEGSGLPTRWRCAIFSHRSMSVSWLSVWLAIKKWNIKKEIGLFFL